MVAVREGDEHLVVDPRPHVQPAVLAGPGRDDPCPRALDLVTERGQLHLDPPEPVGVVDVGHDGRDRSLQGPGALTRDTQAGMPRIVLRPVRGTDELGHQVLAGAEPVAHGGDVVLARQRRADLGELDPRAGLHVRVAVHRGLQPEAVAQQVTLDGVGERLGHLRAGHRGVTDREVLAEGLLRRLMLVGDEGGLGPQLRLLVADAGGPGDRLGVDGVPAGDLHRVRGVPPVVPDRPRDQFLTLDGGPGGSGTLGEVQLLAVGPPFEPDLSGELVEQGVIGSRLRDVGVLETRRRAGHLRGQPVSPGHVLHDLLRRRLQPGRRMGGGDQSVRAVGRLDRDDGLLAGLLLDDTDGDDLPGEHLRGRRLALRQRHRQFLADAQLREVVAVDQFVVVVEQSQHRPAGGVGRQHDLDPGESVGEARREGTAVQLDLRRRTDLRRHQSSNVGTSTTRPAATSNGSRMPLASASRRHRVASP